MFFTIFGIHKYCFRVYIIPVTTTTKESAMSLTEARIEKLLRQFDDAVFTDDSGMENALLRQETFKRYEEAEKKGEPFTITRARLIEFQLDNVRLAVNDLDMFAHLVQRFYLGNGTYPNALTDIQSKRTSLFSGTTSYAVNGYYYAALDLSHTTPDWDAILTLGIPGLLARAQERHKKSPSLFTESVIIVYTAFRRFVLRFAAIAEKGGRNDLAQMLRFLADHAPETLQQALQLGLLYRHLQEIEGEWVRSNGIFDRQYLPFYERDLAEGRLTEESAQDLLDCYFSRFYAESHASSAGAPFCFGGYLPGGEKKDGCNALTRLAWNAMGNLGQADPKFALRVNPDTPEEILHEIAACIQDGKNATVFVNEITAGKMFLRNGKEEEDLANFVPIGCYEPAIMGKELSCTMEGVFNAVKSLEIVLASGEEPETFEGFFQLVQKEVHTTLSHIMDLAKEKEKIWNKVNPSPALSGTLKECMEQAKDVSEYGTKYNTGGIVFLGIGTLVDSLCAIQYLVYDKKRLTLAELNKIMDADWEGNEMLRQEVIARAPKWGCGNPAADELAKIITTSAGELIMNTPNAKGSHFQMGLWSIDRCMSYGKLTKATPDGRKTGDPLSKNTGSTIGCDREGIPGLLESTGKLDYTLFSDGSVLDILMTPRHAAGPEGIRLIVGIIRKFFADGGFAIHFNVLSPATLRAAQKNPEKYQNLQVRLCGWNAKFVDLDAPTQECLIREAEGKD